jgi:hypothetical protein
LVVVVVDVSMSRPTGGLKPQNRRRQEREKKEQHADNGGDASRFISLPPHA